MPGCERVCFAQRDRIAAERLGRAVDHDFERRHRLQCAVTAHRAGWHRHGGESHRGHIHLWNIVDTDRGGCGHQPDTGGIVGQAAAVAGQIGRVGDKLAALAIDAELAGDLKSMTLKAGLKLLETVIGEANGRIGGEQAGQSHVKRKNRMIAAAKAAADRGAMRDDVLHAQTAGGLAHQLSD